MEISRTHSATFTFHAHILREKNALFKIWRPKNIVVTFWPSVTCRYCTEKNNEYSLIASVINGVWTFNSEFDHKNYMTNCLSVYRIEDTSIMKSELVLYPFKVCSIFWTFGMLEYSPFCEYARQELAAHLRLLVWGPRVLRVRSCYLV